KASAACEAPRMFRPQADIAVLVAVFVVVAESIAPSLSRLFVEPATGKMRLALRRASWPHPCGVIHRRSRLNTPSSNPRSIDQSFLGLGKSSPISRNSLGPRIRALGAHNRGWRAPLGRVALHLQARPQFGVKSLPNRLRMTLRSLP